MEFGEEISKIHLFVLVNESGTLSLVWPDNCAILNKFTLVEAKSLWNGSLYFAEWWDNEMRVLIASIKRNDFLIGSFNSDMISHTLNKISLPNHPVHVSFCGTVIIESVLRFCILLLVVINWTVEVFRNLCSDITYTHAALKSTLPSENATM